MVLLGMVRNTLYPVRNPMYVYVDKYQIHVYLTKVDPPIILKLKQLNIFLRIVPKITEVLD